MDYSIPGFEHVLVVPKSDFIGTEYVSLICKKYPNVRLIHDSGTGIYSAMNVGACEASGNFLMFWNAGELLCNSEHFSNLIEVIQIEPYSVFVAGWHDNVGEHLPSYNLVKAFLCASNSGFISHQAVLLSSNLFEELSGFDTRYRVAADTKMLRVVFSEYEVGLFAESVVWVEPQEFSSLNHRRARFEFLKIICSERSRKYLRPALLNFCKRELTFLANRFKRYFRSHS